MVHKLSWFFSLCFILCPKKALNLSAENHSEEAHVTMEAKPLRIVLSSDDKTGEGSGPQREIDRGWTTGSVKEKMVEVKEEVELGLGVGDCSATATSSVVFARERCLFTEAQRRELEHQFFIFRHFESGLPVPLNFVIPVVRSVAHTFRPDLRGFYKLFPSFRSFYKGMVDPEPSRCRRTDGKKWRCSKNTVPDQKYCERHMHRGCKRSRKPVETSQVNSSMITKPSGNFQAKLGSNTESIVSNPSSIQFDTTYSVTPSRSLCSSDSIWPADRCKNTIVSADTQNSFSPSTAAVPSYKSATAVFPVVNSVSGLAPVTSGNKSNLNIDKKVDNARGFIYNKSRRTRSNGKGKIIGHSNKISTGVNFSPRSVLQAIIVSGSNNSSSNCINSMEHEPGRCQRTDGKKWRCRSAILPGQKYCATHVHRGAKKRFSDQEPATMPLSSAVATTVARLPLATAMPCIQKASCTLPNTNLSMSIPPCVSKVQYKENSTSCSNSDTTISDDIIEYSYFSA